MRIEAIGKISFSTPKSIGPRGFRLASNATPVFNLVK